VVSGTVEKMRLNELMKDVRKPYILDCLDGLWLNPPSADKNYFPAACCEGVHFEIERRVDI
jgi:hypothetical protein